MVEYAATGVVVGGFGFVEVHVPRTEKHMSECYALVEIHRANRRADGVEEWEVTLVAGDRTVLWVPKNKVFTRRAF
jgi:hypothetical protein